MRRAFAIGILTATMVMAFAGQALAARGGGEGSTVVADAIYADGELFGTVPNGALPYNGNDHSFDRLYVIAGQQAVAEAAPGPGYNGGRWLPVPVTWNVDPYLLTSEDAVMAAADDGDITLGMPQYDATFLCPLIRQ
jgi:hypothetical protein